MIELFITGNAEPIKIKAFKKPDYTEEVSSSEYKTDMIPESYSLDYKVSRINSQEPGGQQTNNYVMTAPSKLSLSFLFDRTGVIPNYEAITNKGIEQDLIEFKKAIYNFDGDIHSPYYLIISWGTLLFKGVALDMSIEYKLFRPNGQPLRAVAKCNFVEFIEKELAAAERNENSPDLTHMRVVKDGDTLPLMTHKIYGDSKYYLEVARLNKLRNFRKLIPGQQIWFPPLQKKS